MASFIVAHPETRERVNYKCENSHFFLLATDEQSGSQGLLPAPSPLRHVRESFPSYGSSISKAKPVKAARLLPNYVF